MTHNTDNQIEAGALPVGSPIANAPFGVETSIDLSVPLHPDQAEALRQLYRQDGLLLIRNQQLSMAQQLDACSIFGPVLRGALDNYLVSNVHNDGLLGNRELLFHNDIPYVPAPYLGGALHAIEVDAGVSPTSYANGFTAYERLPAALKSRIEGLNALHVRERADGRRTRLTDLIPTDNCAVHKVVGHQEGTGRPYLFVNLDMTALVIGMSEAESDELLEELFSYLYAKENIYDHAWQTGDIVIWDNLALQHSRKEITRGTRTLQRVTIANYGYWQQYPVDLPVFDALHSVKPQEELIAS
jgi:taurine dioxygenase